MPGYRMHVKVGTSSGYVDYSIHFSIEGEDADQKAIEKYVSMGEKAAADFGKRIEMMPRTLERISVEEVTTPITPSFYGVTDDNSG